ncbi:MAG: heavy-metal-associated domain-containing protein [Nitrososphaerota archaeon]|jgi:copper chaperone CopZ|nr:heavy-metal-associated domain-containing protein [Nitrososphaerota archaeon]MDG6946018.1 heavy-metal-associated domain-containing protein [Nitrososphaerota archaeon]MDG6947550.1 heavy-metal-associated domain-containing protein [Nitrososphaerota archaeon]
MTSGGRGATAILKTRGLSEPGQARRLRRASAKLDGITRVDINYILGSVTVEYDADKLTSAQVKEMLASSIHASVTRQADPGEGSKVE